MYGTSVAVVGGGIAGTTIAWELARRGVGVTLFEQGSLAAGASGRNTGTLLHQTEPAVAAMLRASIASYAELDPAFDLRWTAREELLLARTASQMERARAKATAISAQGVRVSEIDGGSLRAAFPPFGDEVLGGMVLEGVSTVDAELATRAFAGAAREAGARIRTHVRVARVLNGGLLTDEGMVAADAVVVATGPWLADLLTTNPAIGAAVPAEPSRANAISTASPIASGPSSGHAAGGCPRHAGLVPWCVRAGRGWLLRTDRLDVPWIVEEVSWPDQAALGRAAEPLPLSDVSESVVGECALICPLPDGTALLGASLSTSLRDAVEGFDVPRRIAQRILAVAPRLPARIVRAWSGLRPMTPDGLPIAGRAGELWVHGGHGSLGMQAAPATAAWLAAEMHGEPAPSTYDELRPGRFA